MAPIRCRRGIHKQLLNEALLQSIIGSMIGFLPGYLMCYLLPFSARRSADSVDIASRVRDGRKTVSGAVQAVSLPGTIVLPSCGLIGLVGIRKKLGD